MGVMVAIWNVVKRVVDPNEREVARLLRTADRVLAFDDEIGKLSDEELRAKTGEFRERLGAGEDLDDLLPEAFACVREAADRVISERPFRVQVAGGVALHHGMVMEMKTGEGKTLTATMPLYLNALVGKGAHLVTTNDFLVRWQAEWMGQVFAALGMSTGYIQHAMSNAERRVMYARDITYVENSQLGFDYLRDNMATHPSQLTQRELHYCIVDEADSILIDEARTPLIISGEASSHGADYDYFETLVSKMIRANNDDEPFFTWDRKDHQASLTEAGMIWVEQQMGMKDGALVDAENVEIAQLVDNSLKAHFLYEKDHQYVVKDGEVVIVDEFTGHLQPGRRYSDGLHQAIEAKEHVYTPRERQTVASITYQNFFRIYDKLAGMTGTAKSEEAEFVSVYGARVVVVPTNRPRARKDHPDTIYKTLESKYRGIVNEIINMHVRQQPVLVGTRSVDVSEHIGRRLEGSWLRAHALVQVLLWEVREADGVDKQQREAWLAHLRQPIGELVSQAAHMKRRGKADEVHLADIAEALDIGSDVLAEANLDCLLGIAGVTDVKTDAEALGQYRQRLHAMLEDGMKPGDDDRESQLNILNAKRHETEGTIIAQAGSPGMVTVATNMAGRGVDIVLGGRDPETGEAIPEKYELVKQLGGLHVIGSERHESRRIDNQLRGRSGRQGDPGSSRFYVSLEDDLMKLFGPERVSALTGGWPEEEPVAANLVSKTLERAQMKVEMRHMGIRKNTLKYDDVMNIQRSVVYEQRRRVLDGENVHSSIERMIRHTVENVLATYAPETQPSEEWDLEALYERVRRVVGTPPEADTEAEVEIAASGVSLRLAELYLRRLAEEGEDIAAHLREVAEPYAELSRSMDRKRAEQMARETVQSHIAAVMARFSDGSETVTPARLIDVARAVGELYNGALEDLGLSGIHTIDWRELHEVIPAIAVQVYEDRELALLDTRIIQGVMRLADESMPREQWDLPALEGFLFGFIHDLRPRLAIERLRAVVADGEGEEWLVARIRAAYEELAGLPQKAEQEQLSLRFPTRGQVIDAEAPEEEALRQRVAALAAEYGEGLAELARWDIAGLVYALLEEYPGVIARLADEQLEAMADAEEPPAEVLMSLVRMSAPEGAGEIGYRDFRIWERGWLLVAVDRSWMEHLLTIDDVREGIHLRAHAQRDPLVEYQREASAMFDEMMAIVARRATQYAFSRTEAMEDAGTQVRDLQATQEAVSMADGGEDSGSPMAETRRGGTYVAASEPGRNEPCSCGSGKKYKKCCMLKK